MASTKVQAAASSSAYNVASTQVQAVLSSSTSDSVQAGKRDKVYNKHIFVCTRISGIVRRISEKTGHQVQKLVQ